MLKRLMLFLPMAALVLTLGLGLLSPLILPKIAQLVVRPMGIEWSSVEAQGYRSWQVDALQFSRDGLTVSIDRLEVPQPGYLLLHRFNLSGSARMEGGTVTVEISGTGKEESAESGGPRIIEGVTNNLPMLRAWIPEAEVESVLVRKLGWAESIHLTDVVYRGYSVSARMDEFRRMPASRFQVYAGPGGPRLGIETADTADQVRMALIIDTNGGDYQLMGHLYSIGNPMLFSGNLSSDRWWLQGFRLAGTDWSVPVFIFPESDLLLGPPILTVDAVLEGSDYIANFSLRSTGTLPGSSQESIVADIEIKGDRESVDIKRLQIQTNWLSANLSEPVRYIFDKRVFTGNAHFTADAQLDRQSWIAASGAVRAEIEVHSDTVELPQVSYSMSGDGLLFGDVSVQEVSVSGTLDYPDLHIRSAEISPDEGSRLSGSGSFVMDTGKVSGEGKFIVTPEWLSSVVPYKGIRSNLEGSWQVGGERGRILHSGSIEPVAVEFTGLHPLTVAVHWSGEGAKKLDLVADLQTQMDGDLHLLIGMIRPESGGQIELDLEEVVLKLDGESVLRLESPVRLQADPSAGFPLSTITPFRFVSGARELFGHLGGSTQSVGIGARQFELSVLNAWLTKELPDLMIEEALIDLSRFDPLLIGNGSLILRSLDERLDNLNLNIDGSIDTSGIRLDSIQGQVDEQSFVEGDLELPIQVHLFPEEGNSRIQPVENGALGGNLSAEISPALARDFSGIPYLEQLSGTDFKLSLGGTLQEPLGSIEAEFPSLPGRLLGPSFSEYDLDEIELSALLSPDSLTLESLKAKVRDASIEVKGLIRSEPLAGMFQGEPVDWQRVIESADLSLSVRNVLATSFSSLMPGYLRPTGLFTADVRVRPGLDLDGQIRLSQFSIRPTLYSQTIDAISAELNLKGTRMDLAQATAKIGESLVSLDGFIDIGNWLNPVYRLEITGTRTPLIRTPDLLLHADVDLLLDRMDPEVPATLSGTLAMRDSILLLDIDPLAARTAGKAVPKPPFFSIEQAPFGEWDLDVAISGEDSIRFRSQFAKSLLSINMHLDGTLASPVLLGSIFTSNGQIEFPGTRLSLSRSEVFVSRERQTSLQMDLNSIGRASSYILTMQVKGTIDEPQVEFASTPALSNAQIFHLLATGSLERSGVSSFGLYLGKGLLGPGSGNAGLLDRLSIEVGRDISESGKNTIDLFYDLTERLRLHGQYDKYDAQNLDLEWEVFSR